jgi:two-component system cell cycle sensor histidine kinase/response regulator CckA
MMGISATALILSGVLIITSQLKAYREVMIVDLMQQIQMIANNVQAAVAFNDNKDAKLILGTLSSQPNIAYAGVTLRDGSPLAEYRRADFTGEPQTIDSITQHTFITGWLIARHPIILDDEEIGTVHMQSDLSKLELFKRQIITIVCGSLVSILVLSWLLSFRLQKIISAPVEKLTETVRLISRSKDYSIRSRNTSHDEIGVLSQAFNDMLAELELRDEQLQDREKRTRQYLDIADVMIISLDRDGRVNLINPKGCDILEMEEHEILGKNWIEHFIPERIRGDISDTLNATRNGELPNDMENVIVTAKGRERLISWHNTVLRNIRGEIEGVLSSGEDITEHREAEKREAALQDQLARAERMETVGVLAGGVAHDLNNILGPLVMLPELLIDDVKQAADGDQSAYKRMLDSINTMQNSANRAASVVKSLLTLSRRGHVERKPMDINTLSSLTDTSGSIHNLKQAHPNVSIQVTRHKTPLMIMASDSHLNRVVDNLIRNAAESIAREGAVEVHVAPKHLENDHEGYTHVPPGNYATIEVSDTGCGIPHDQLNRIFEPFYTSKKQSEHSGSGLGLSVVHGIIGDHDGYIDVASEMGKGTTFCLFFPLTQDEKIETQERQSAPMKGKGNILVVDDEQSQRFLARSALSRWGFTVDLAENGRNAITFFETARNNQIQKPYQAVVLDMRMEPDFDGLDTLKAIRQLYPDQKVLIASGHATDDRSSAALAMGARWLSKPYSLNQLQEAIFNLING